MEKIGNLIRRESEKQLTAGLKESEGVLVVGFRGLSGADMDTLRKSLSANRSRLLVVKNTVARRVFAQSKIEGLCAAIEGPCGLILVKDDIIAASKVVSSFTKEHVNLKVAAGLLRRQMLNPADISTLASLPGKKTLYTQLAITVKSPLSALAAVLSNSLRKLVIVLNEIKIKRG